VHQLKAFQLTPTANVGLKQMKENILKLQAEEGRQENSQMHDRGICFVSIMLSITVTAIITVFLCKTYSLHRKHALRELLNYFHFLSRFLQFSEFPLVLKVLYRNFKVNAAMSLNIKGLLAVGMQ
jgi:hypothetical protein